MDLLVLSWMAYSVVYVLLIMAFFWLVYIFSRIPEIVDVGWALSLGFTSLFYFFLADSPGWRQWLLLSITSLWAFKLLYHLITRLFHGWRDGRYDELNSRWRTGLYWKYLIFFYVQGGIVVILSLPFAIGMHHNAPLNWFDLAAVILFTIGFFGTFFADRTKQTFRANPENAGKICEDGLWFLSRHPNYFFEMFMWVGFALFALTAPLGWLGFISPILIMYLLLFVTGIPPTESYMLGEYGEKYREYQISTSPFIPWFKKGTVKEKEEVNEVSDLEANID